MSTVSKVLSNPPDNFSTTLSSNISSSELTIPLNDVTGLGTEGVGVIFQKDSDGNPVTSTIEFIHWTGKSGNNLTLTDTGDRGLSGSASGAQAHSAGDTFEVWVHSSYYHGDFAGVEHNADGTHDDSKVAMLAGTQTFTGNKTFGGTLTASGGFTAGSGAQFNTEAVFDAEYDNGNSGSAKTIDWTNGNKQKLTITENTTLTFTDPSGPCNLILKLVNGGAYTITWPGEVKWADGSEPSWTSSGTDIVALYYDGSSYFAQGSLNFS